MNDAAPKTIKGKIKSIGLSGFGPDSGESTLVIGPPGKGQKFYAGILDQNHQPQGIEHGVFAGFVTIATVAFSTRATVECTYLERDKARITGLFMG